jgi:hypothetical protein
MSKARDLANAGTALTTVSATELGYLDGVTSAVQTQINSKIGQSTAINPSTVTTKGDLLVATGSGTIVRQGVGTDGQFLQAASAQADGVQWATVSQYTLPTQTGNSGKFLTTNGTTESWGTVTTPPSWKLVKLGGTTGRLHEIAYNGSNLWVAVGDQGALFTSPDAQTWTSRTSGFGSNRISSVAFGNGLWVAVGQNGTITTSTDGVTWTARTSNMSTNEIFQVKYANSLWVACGEGGGTTNTGGLTYSTDGITWTRKSQSVTIGTVYYDVVWNGTNWIIGTNATTNNYLYASTPSGTWTVGNAGNGTSIMAIYWDGTRNIIIDNNQLVGFSTSATLGTVTMLSGVFFKNPYNRTSQSNKLYNGKLYGANTYFYTLTISSNSGQKLDGNMYPSPTNIPSGAGGALTDNTVGLWVGAQGALMSSTEGAIWSTF